MERSQFTFYESFRKAIGRIKKKQDRADAYDAICDYALYGIEPDLENMADAAAIAFELIRPNLDASRRKASGGSSGKPTKDPAKITERCGKDTVNKKEKEKEKEKEKKKEGEKEKEYECIPPTPFSGRLQVAFEDWVAYKKERREPYKETGLKNLIGQIRNAAAQYGDDAVEGIIRESMASGYKGITFDRLKKLAKQKPINPFMREEVCL